MLNFIHRTMVKRTIFALLVVSLLALNVPQARAFTVTDNDNTATRTITETNDAAAKEIDKKAAEKPAGILYAPFNDVHFEAETISTAPPKVFDKALRVSLNIPTGNTNNMPLPTPPADRVLRKIPMTVGEKFMFFAKSSFLSVGPYANAAFSGVRGEALDKDEDPNGEKGHFFADAGTRAARNFAFGSSQKFFHRFMLASIFRQDPRYLRSGKKGAGAKIAYAVSRVFITEGDKGGSQFNISFLGGSAGAAFLSRLYEREERRSLGKVLGRFGNNVSFTALTNIVREFVSGQ